MYYHSSVSVTDDGTIRTGQKLRIGSCASERNGAHYLTGQLLRNSAEHTLFINLNVVTVEMAAVN